MILQLNLKKKWFDLIERGEKLEEYREIKWFWLVRLLCWSSGNRIRETWNKELYTESLILWVKNRTIKKGDEMIGFDFKDYTHVRFRHGYAKDAPFVTFEVREICISEGVLEWGAVPGERYFVIKLGERLL